MSIETEQSLPYLVIRLEMLVHNLVIPSRALGCTRTGIDKKYSLKHRNILSGTPILMHVQT